VEERLHPQQRRNKGGASGVLAPGAVHVGEQKLKISKLQYIKYIKQYI
jgi:hypothetical protein